MGSHRFYQGLMRLSSIDIGTNTILMLIADVYPNGEIHVARDEHFIARLGKGVDEHRRILPDTFERVFQCLSQYKLIHEEARSERILACGTSALRDAVNRDEFIEFIKSRLGFEITVLSGDKEAELTYLGSVSEFLQEGFPQSFAVIDIGGGSTELTYGLSGAVTSKRSLDIGSVRLTERFLKTSPPDNSALQEAAEYIRDHANGFPQLENGTRCIGVAGTLTTLAAIDLQLRVYDRTRVSGHVLSLEAIQKIFVKLKDKRLEEIKAIPQILPQRADIILAGILILCEMMKQIGVDRITASDRGLRYGILMNEAKRLSTVG
jgi:exopolyphosphatase/guanosine-5'-triphosphate,3'-diphosphate pyrophosphatase